MFRSKKDLLTELLIAWTVIPANSYSKKDFSVSFFWHVYGI